MITKTPKHRGRDKLGLTERSLRHDAYAICTILSAQGTLKISEIQEATSFGRESIVFSIGWLVGQGVVILRGRMDDLDVRLAAQHGSTVGEKQ